MKKKMECFIGEYKIFNYQVNRTYNEIEHIVDFNKGRVVKFYSE